MIQQPHSGLSQENQDLSGNHLHSHVHGSIIYSSQDMETA